jgi:hypothetical protein
MSYYVINKGNIYEATAGLGATVKDLPYAQKDVVYRAIRNAQQAVGAMGYQPLKDRPFMYRSTKDAKLRAGRAGLYGLGAAMEYDGAAMWSAQNACNTAWQASKTVVPQCTTWVNTTRAALARLGYGQLTQNASWGSADQAATKKFASDNGLPVPSNGYPTQAIHMKIEANISAPTPVVTGDKPPVEVEPVPGTNEYAYVQPKTDTASGETQAKKGLSTAQLALIGVGLVGVAAVAIALKKRGSRSTVSAGAGIQTPLPGAVPGTGVA